MERGEFPARIGAILSIGGLLMLAAPVLGGAGASAAAPAVAPAAPVVLGAAGDPGIVRVLPAPAEPESEPNVMVYVEGSMPVTSRPGGGRVVGTMAAGSKYYRAPLVAWVLETARHGRYGLVTLPYSGSRETGWIPLRGLETATTWVTVEVDLSRHVVVVERRDRVIARFPAATGSPVSPTPPGKYFVTDRVPFGGGSYYGSFAFGISGIQTNLPPGWSGGNQLAIHGTNDPSSIGRSVSAGCLRVSEAALDRLKPLLDLGTPVVIRS